MESQFVLAKILMSARCLLLGTQDVSHLLSSQMHFGTISELPVSSDLWIGYTSYLDRSLKVPSVLRSVYYRATRNCTWVAELWVHYLLSLERIHSSEEELRHVFEQGVQCSFPTIQEYLNVYLTRVHSLRRRISDGLDFQLIRKTFMDAAEFLSPQLGTKELLHLNAYWAKLERNLGKDLAAARGVWENTIKKSGSVLEVWQQYISMEMEMGNIHEARSLYKRCYSKRFAGSGSEVSSSQTSIRTSLSSCYHGLKTC